MNAEEQQAISLFEQALAQPADERTGWLQRTVAGNETLRNRVAELLRAEDRSEGFLEPPEVAPHFHRRLGAYEILRPLSEGGMGQVYVARRADDAYHQEVAIKLIRTDLWGLSQDQQRELKDRFVRERQILAQLSHPHIARILDGGETPEGQPYIVMELIDGEPLDRWLRRSRPEVVELLSLFAKVCDAVQEAHRNLIVHRDLKPGNILVNALGEPQLLDFGIAKILGDPGTNTSITRTAAGALTPAYASPEQVSGQAPVTTASDVYSLGVLLYELLTGARPYSLVGASPAQAERTICHTEPDPPSSRLLKNLKLAPGLRRRDARRLRGDLDNIVLKAMRKEPARRYPSAAELAADLRRYMSGQPVAAHRASLTYRAGKFIRRNRALTSVSGLFLLALLGTTGFALKQAQEAQRAADLSNRMNSFLLDTLGSADPYASGVEPTIGEVLKAAEARIGEQFAGSPELEAQIRHSLGYSAMSRHELDTAERLLTQALQLRQGFLSSGDPDLTASLDALAWLDYERGNSSAARARFEEAIAAIEAAGRTPHPIYATTLNDFAVMELNEERIESGVALLAKAREAAFAPRSQTEMGERISITENLAYALNAQGKGAEARALYEQSLAAAREHWREGHPNLAIHLNNVGQLYFDEVDPETGLAMVQESLTMRRRFFPGDHPDVWRATRNLAAMYDVAGRPDEALPLAEEALGMARRLYPDGHANLGISLITLAQLLQEPQQRPRVTQLLDEAERVLRAADGDQQYWLDEIQATRPAAEP
ncbi:MAG: serine/threonine-protein kinase [Pseudomonadota bacterium]